MIESTSSFLVSSIPLYHNAFKSIIFKGAELLMGLFIYKVFALIAARSKQFTSYLMFAEDYIQRFWFISSRGFSQAGFIVLAFSLLNILAALYGTLLWALDSPGYLFRPSDATVADYANRRNENAPYVIQLYLDPSNLQNANKSLSQTLGSDMFNPGLNYTLTGQVRLGTPEIGKRSQRDDVGARIWLDDDGFSVSADSYLMYPTNYTLEGQNFPLSCIHYTSSDSYWDCTFNNVFARDFVNTITGRPEVHWDEKSDIELNSRYVAPSRVDNIWHSFGAGAGSTAMMQVFTVNKKKKRHTFSQSTVKYTMLTSPDIPFARREVKDFVQRSWGPNKTEQANAVIDQIVKGIMSAQGKGLSYQTGASISDNQNLTVLQSNWGFFTLKPPNGVNLLSIISVAATNITLLRSETVNDAPVPFGKCSHASFQNEAFGGKVTETDCAGSKPESSPEFFGQVDTAAVLIAHGLGDLHSNVSSESLNEDVLSWIRNNTDRLESLVVARGYATSVDPSLVTISIDNLMVAMSGVQLFLTCLAVVLAAISWFTLSIFTDPFWSNTFLANIVHTTSGVFREAKPGYMYNPPDVSVLTEIEKRSITISERIVRLYDPSPIPMQPVVSQPTQQGPSNQYYDASYHSAGGYDASTGTEHLLSGYPPAGYSSSSYPPACSKEFL